MGGDGRGVTFLMNDNDDEIHTLLFTTANTYVPITVNI